MTVAFFEETFQFPRCPSLENVIPAIDQGFQWRALLDAHSVLLANEFSRRRTQSCSSASTSLRISISARGWVNVNLES